MMKLYLAPLLVVFALSASACGPIRSTVGLIRADKALAEAREMNAAEHAPYPMTLAESLRDKAWEEQGYARYDTSMNMATEAEKLAREAMQVTRDIVAPLPPSTEGLDLFGDDESVSEDAEPSSETAEPSSETTDPASKTAEPPSEDVAAPASEEPLNEEVPEGGNAEGDPS
jgi:hypothetical protein